MYGFEYQSGALSTMVYPQPVYSHDTFLQMEIDSLSLKTRYQSLGHWMWHHIFDAAEFAIWL